MCNVDCLFSCIPKNPIWHMGHLRFGYVDWTYLAANQFGIPLISEFHAARLRSYLGFNLPWGSNQVSPPSQMLWKCMVWYLKGLQSHNSHGDKKPSRNFGSFKNEALNLSVSIAWFRILKYSYSFIFFLWMGIIAREFTQTDPYCFQCNLTTDTSSLRWKVPSMCHPVRLARQQLLGQV